MAPTPAVLPVNTNSLQGPNAPGAVTPATGGSSAAPVSAPAAVTTPQNPPVSTAPTMADIYGAQGPLDTEAAKAGSAAVDAYGTDTLTKNQGLSRADILSQYQDKINALDEQSAAARAAITAGFAPTQLATDRANAARTGNAGATSAARGLAGSAFGDAMVGNAALANEADTRANFGDLASKLQTSDQTFANQKLALNEFVSGEIDKETALRQSASQQGADAKVKEIQDRTSRMQAIAQNSARAMITAGITDPSNPNYADTIKNISQATGLSKAEVEGMVQTTIQQAQATAATTAKANAEAAAAGRTTLSPGQKVYDAKGNLIASVPVANKYVGVPITDMLGNQRLAIYDQTTGKPVGYGDQPSGPTGDGSSAVTGSGSAIAGASTAKGDGAAPDSHLPIVTTLNGNSFDKNGDATSGTPAPKAGLDNKAVPFEQYGLLAKTDFKPNDPVDQLANQYLQLYFQNGQIPTAGTMGRNIKPGLMAEITSRAGNLYYGATGTHLPSTNTLQAQQDIIKNNYKLGNNLAIQEDLVGKNVNLSLDNMTKNGLNSSGFLPLNNLIDSVKNAFGDPQVAQLLSQNVTLQNEMGSLMAVKNAGGTTVYDKLESAGLINSKMSPAQVKQVIATMMTEAKNFASALSSANATAYSFTDPLLQDPNNPARATYLGGADAGPGGSTNGSTGSGVDLSNLDFSIGQ